MGRGFVQVLIGVFCLGVSASVLARDNIDPLPGGGDGGIDIGDDPPIFPDPRPTFRPPKDPTPQPSPSPSPKKDFFGWSGFPGAAGQLKQVPLPCNYKWVAELPVYAKCTDAIPRVNELMKQRLKVLIRGGDGTDGKGGYYGGEVLTFDGAEPGAFPKPVCDLNSGETSQNKLGGFIERQCGQRCQLVQPDSANQYDYHVDLSTCKREGAYLRGGWIRNASSKWKAIAGRMNRAKSGLFSTDKGLPIPSHGYFTQISGNETDSPCVELAEDYLRVLARVVQSPLVESEATMSVMETITPEQCKSGAKSQEMHSACHLLQVRNATEAMFSHLAACIQFTLAMDEHREFVLKPFTKKSDTTSKHGGIVTSIYAAATKVCTPPPKTGAAQTQATQDAANNRQPFSDAQFCLSANFQAQAAGHYAAGGHRSGALGKFWDDDYAGELPVTKDDTFQSKIGEIFTEGLKR